MEIFKVVPTLEKLAHDRAYAAILQDLELCYGHSPAGNRFYLRSPECEDALATVVGAEWDKKLWG